MQDCAYNTAAVLYDKGDLKFVSGIILLYVVLYYNRAHKLCLKLSELSYTCFSFHCFVLDACVITKQVPPIINTGTRNCTAAVGV